MADEATTHEMLERELEAIRAQYGALTPQLVVDEARDPSHALHDQFEWDDSRAAEAHRKSQARGLIRRVRVRFESARTGEQESVRAYTSMPVSAGSNDRSYEPTRDVLSDEFARRMVLNRAKSELAAWQKRYADLAEFDAIVHEVLGREAV